MGKRGGNENLLSGPLCAEEEEKGVRQRKSRTRRVDCEVNGGKIAK